MYPIHAYVEFEEAGRKLVAHPILLVLPRQSNPPRANPQVEWKPFPVAANGALALWRLPLHREHVRVEQNTSFGAAPNPVYETQPAIAFSGQARRPAAGRSMESITVRLGPTPRRCAIASAGRRQSSRCNCRHRTPSGFDFRSPSRARCQRRWRGFGCSLRAKCCSKENHHPRPGRIARSIYSVSPGRQSVCNSKPRRRVRRARPSQLRRSRSC